MRRPTPTRSSLRRSLNALTAPRIVVREVVGRGADFDARFSAVSRTYRYFVLERRGARPVPVGPRLVAGRAARSGCPGRGVPTIAREPRLHVLLSTPAGAARTTRWSAGSSRADWTEEPGRPTCSDSRSGPRRSATRWCGASWASSSTSGGGGERRRTSPPPSAPRTARPLASSPRPTDCSCGTSIWLTDSMLGTSNMADCPEPIATVAERRMADLSVERGYGVRPRLLRESARRYADPSASRSLRRLGSEAGPGRDSRPIAGPSWPMTVRTKE